MYIICMMITKSTTRRIKAQLIRDINQILIETGNESLNVADFDLLYDLDIDELENAKIQLKTQLSEVKLVTSN